MSALPVFCYSTTVVSCIFWKRFDVENKAGNVFIVLHEVAKDHKSPTPPQVLHCLKILVCNFFLHRKSEERDDFLASVL